MAHAHVTDDELRELYERALTERGAPERVGCVSAEAILALVRREGTEQRRLATLDHVMACAACRRELELLRAIERAGEETGAVRARVLSTTSGWRRGAPFALAASVLLAVGVGVWQRGRGGPDVERGAPDSVSLVAPRADAVATAPVTFVWHAAPQTRRYELELLDAAGSPVFSLATGDTVATLPDVRRLTPGADYHWWVRAVGDAGTQRASPMRRLRARSE